MSPKPSTPSPGGPLRQALTLSKRGEGLEVSLASSSISNPCCRHAAGRRSSAARAVPPPASPFPLPVRLLARRRGSALRPLSASTFSAASAMARPASRHVRAGRRRAEAPGKCSLCGGWVVCPCFNPRSRARLPVCEDKTRDERSREQHSGCCDRRALQSLHFFIQF